MRRTGRLSSGRLTDTERWELALFLAILVIGCISLTAVFHFDAFPRLFASAFGSEPQTAPTAPAPEPLPSLLEIETTQPPVVPLVQPPQVIPVRPVNITRQPSLPTTEAPRARITRKPAEDIRVYNGRKYRYVKTLKLRVTSYAPDPRCCWPYPGTTTASGLSVKTNGGRLVAADTRLIPMHALVSVPGYSNGAPVPVLDRGGAIRGHRLDVMLPTFEKAKDWGSRLLEVKVYMPVNE